MIETKKNTKKREEILFFLVILNFMAKRKLFFWSNIDVLGDWGGYFGSLSIYIYDYMHVFFVH